MRQKKQAAVLPEKLLFSRQALNRLIWPLVGEQFLAVMTGMADTVMVASAGESAVSAVSLVDSINILMINIFSALAAGGAIVVSQYLGNRDEENAGSAAKQLVVVIGALSTVLGLACAFTRGPLLGFLFGRVDAAVMTNASKYFFITAFSYPFLAVYNAGAAIFRSMGNSRVSLRASLIANGVNFAGNALCIYGLGWGVVGAAIPTLISRIVGAALILRMLQNPGLQITLTDWKHFRLQLPMVRRILGIGIPNGLENGMFQVGKILVQSLIATFGTASIAANAVSNTLCTLPQIPAQGVGLAMTTVVGQCVGAGDYPQASHYIKKLTGIAFGCNFVLCIAFYLGAPLTVLPFALTAGTAAMTLRISRTYYLVCMAIWVLSFTFPNGLRAAGDVRFTMSASMISMWVFRIGFSYLLAQYLGMGIFGVWYAMYIDWIVRVLSFVARYASGRWKTKRVI